MPIIKSTHSNNGFERTRTVYIFLDAEKSSNQAGADTRFLSAFVNDVRLESLKRRAQQYRSTNEVGDIISRIRIFGVLLGHTPIRRIQLIRITFYRVGSFDVYKLM